MTIDEKSALAVQSGLPNAGFESAAYARFSDEKQRLSSIVDQVRDAQGAGIAHVANTGLNQTQAVEEFRRERRVALYLRGVAFYDARRWGVTAPIAAGGGRTNALVVVPGTIISSVPGTPAQALPCTIDYSFLDYWDVPQNELDFNNAATGSAPIKN